MRFFKQKKETPYFAMHSSGQNACFLSFFFLQKKRCLPLNAFRPAAAGKKKKSRARALRTGRRGARGARLILTYAKESRVPVGSCGVLSDFGGGRTEAPSKWVDVGGARAERIGRLLVVECRGCGKL